MKPYSFLSLLYMAPFLATGQEGIPELDVEYSSQTGTAYTIILDDSGSMNTYSKLTQAKDAFTNWVSQTPEGNTWSLITLNNPKMFMPFTQDGKEQVKARIAEAQAHGGTPIVQSLLQALANIQTRRLEVTPYERHIVVLLTDGHETADPRQGKGVQETLQQLRQEQVEVYGIGFYGEGDYMDGYATHYFMANDKEQLSKGLSKVGAEVPIDVEFEISPEEKKAMATLALWTPSMGSASSANEEAPPEKVPFNWTWVFPVMAGYILLRVLMTSKKSR